MKVLGIETSCDETAVCLIEAEGDFGVSFRWKTLGNALISQAAMHAEFGGVFPNLAKREHLKNLPILLERVSQETGAVVPDVIAVTVGPGLEPCLWTGITFAQRLAAQWNVPVVATNHMEGHIIMSMMASDGLKEFDLPVLALLISGGHTELILTKASGTYEYLGRTRDDAVGEAFDKVARMLALPYPGGPKISKLAEEARASDMRSEYKLPRPMLNENNFDFSFSGLKTAALRLVENKELSLDDKKKIAREFEDAAADVLVAKTLRAVEAYGANTVVVGGGVSANKHIRAELEKRLTEVGATLLVCPPELSTDNAIMIALAGYFHALKNEFADPEELAANGNLKLC